MGSESLIPVYWPVDFLQGDAIRQALLHEGIFCHLEGENQSGMIGVGPLGNVTRWTMKVLVRAKDAERARKIIEAGDWPTYA